MKKLVLFMFMSLILVACGDDRAPDGAIVSGPVDGSLTVTATNQAQTFTSPLHFIVRDGSGEDANLLPKIEIEFFASPPVFFSDLAGNQLSTPLYIKTNTDDRGLASVVASIFSGGCEGTEGEVNKVNKGTVLATVGTASATWTGTLTIECGSTIVTP